MYKTVILLLLTSVLFSSCIAHKDIVYFQGDEPDKVMISEVNNKPYRLKIDDILQIDLKANDNTLVSVFNNSNTNNTTTNTSSNNAYFYGYTVDKQGFIHIPYLDKINVLGFTTDEVATQIKDGLGQFFKDTSDIFVNVKLAGFKFTIIGEVSNTGTIYLYQNSVNIIEAIANAGDITITGNRKAVEILRPTINGTDRFVVDLTNINVFNSKHYYLQPNDIIYVPPIKQKTLGTGTTGLQTFTSLMSVLSVLTTTVLLIKNIK